MWDMFPACKFCFAVGMPDVRYQSADEPVEQKSLLPHCDLTWKEIYAGWEDGDLKYYWEKMPLCLVPWEDSYMQPSTRIC
jgi:hypothetical protein